MPTPVHEQLEECIRSCTNRTGLKIIVAPSSHAARMIRAALARQGCPLVNVEALTPAELARHVVRTMQPDDRRRMISRSEGAFLVRRLTANLDPETAELMSGAAFPLWSAVQELRASGVAPSDVARAARRPHEKVLAELHANCEAYMADHHLRDAADILLEAIRLADEFAERRAPELVAVLDGVRVGQQEERLIRAISGAAGRFVRTGIGNSDWPSDRAAVVLADWPVAGGRKSGEIFPGTSGTILAGERREEVASVLSDIVRRGLSFDDVEIAFTSVEPYRSEIRAACRRYGIPFSEAGLQPLVETRTGASVVAALRWVAAGYPVDGLVSMLRLGYIRPSRGHAVDISAVLDRFPVSLAEAARPAIRDRLIERARQEYVDVGHLLDAFRMMDALRKIVPGGARGTGAGLLRFVESFLRDHACADARTDEAASLVLRELAFLGGPDAESGFKDETSAASFAVKVLERLSVRIGPDGGGLSIVKLEDAGFSRASHVYVVGLDDQSCADRQQEDSLLTDSFRSRLHEVAGRGPLAEKPVFVTLLLGDLEASRPGGVTRCRALYDIALDRPLFPIALGRAEDDTDEKRTAAAPVGPDILDLTDGFLADPTGTTPEYAGALFENIERGRLATAARKSTSWTAFDGVVSTDEGDLPDLLPDTHSPSALEALAACPYRYFLRYVLRVPVLESRDPDEWMSASDRGRILHTLFERHARRRMSEGAASRDEESSWLSAEVRDLLDEFTAVNPPPHDAFLEEARREIEAACAVYMHAEHENGDREPQAAEFRFGTDDDADAPPLEMAMSGGATLALTGRVDRIDLTPDGGLIVTDFKTGKRRGLSESDLRKLDTKLQWAVYARLARDHFGRAVEASGYLFTSSSELGLRREAAPPPDEELDRILGEMFSRVEAGFFARNANPNGDPCSYCDFRSVCGDLRARRDEMRVKSCASVEAGDRHAPLVETWNAFSPRNCS